jgi:hypothetical protein
MTVWPNYNSHSTFTTTKPQVNEQQETEKPVSAENNKQNQVFGWKEMHKISEEVKKELKNKRVHVFRKQVWSNLQFFWLMQYTHTTRTNSTSMHRSPTQSYQIVFWGKT